MVRTPPAPARPRSRRGLARRDALLAGVGVAVLGAAFWFATRPAAPDLPPEIADAQLAFACGACGQQFELSGRETRAALSGGGPRSASAGGFPCPHCGQAAGYRLPPASAP